MVPTKMQPILDETKHQASTQGSKQNVIYFHTCEHMPEVENGLARLVIASPPYTNCADGVTMDKANYLQFVLNVFAESKKKLMPGGVLVTINTDLKDHARYNCGEGSFEGQVWYKHQALRHVAEIVGYKQFDHKIWVKALTENRFRFNFSHIQMFQIPGKKFRHHPLKHTQDYGPSVWYLEDSMQRRDSKGNLFRDAFHPEIARRCIREFTQPGELVVSPFTGSGTIPASAYELCRNFIGYETNKKLKRIIRESIYGPRPEIYSRIE